MTWNPCPHCNNRCIVNGLCIHSEACVQKFHHRMAIFAAKRRKAGWDNARISARIIERKIAFDAIEQFVPELTAQRPPKEKYMEMLSDDV